MEHKESKHKLNQLAKQPHETVDRAYNIDISELNELITFSHSWNQIIAGDINHPEKVDNIKGMLRSMHLYFAKIFPSKNVRGYCYPPAASPLTADCIYDTSKGLSTSEREYTRLQVQF